MVKIEAKKHDLKTYTCPLDICVDNGAMIAWNGWELKNAEQDVDIRDMAISGHKSMPLGNYLVDHLVKQKISGVHQAHIYNKAR